MLQGALKIQLPQLPYRARTLSPEEVSAVFGGCVDERQPCEKDSDCCSYDNGTRVGKQIVWQPMICSAVNTCKRAHDNY